MINKSKPQQMFVGKCGCHEKQIFHHWQWNVAPLGGAESLTGNCSLTAEDVHTLAAGKECESLTALLNLTFVHSACSQSVAFGMKLLSFDSRWLLTRSRQVEDLSSVMLHNRGLVEQKTLGRSPSDVVP